MAGLVLLSWGAPLSGLNEGGGRVTRQAPSRFFPCPTAFGHRAFEEERALDHSLGVGGAARHTAGGVLFEHRVVIDSQRNFHSIDEESRRPSSSKNI